MPTLGGEKLRIDMGEGGASNESSGSALGAILADFAFFGFERRGFTADCRLRFTVLAVFSVTRPRTY